MGEHGPREVVSSQMKTDMSGGTAHFGDRLSICSRGETQERSQRRDSEVVEGKTVGRDWFSGFSFSGSHRRPAPVRVLKKEVTPETKTSLAIMDARKGEKWEEGGWG